VGGVVFNDEIKYEKLDFDDIGDETFKSDMKGGWIAMIEHFFLSAWVPDQQETNFTYTSHPTSNRYKLGMRSPAAIATKGTTAEFESSLVVGTKLQDRAGKNSTWSGANGGLRYSYDFG